MNREKVRELLVDLATLKDGKFWATSLLECEIYGDIAPCNKDFDDVVDNFVFELLPLAPGEEPSVTDEFLDAFLAAVIPVTPTDVRAPP